MAKMLYTWKVRFLKTRRGNLFWRYWRAWRGSNVGEYRRLPEYIRRYAPGRSFVDIGCMWGVNGEYTFLAEEAGATIVKGVDVFGPTPEFEAKRLARNSSVEFILGDAGQPSTIERIGVMDVVFCAGVLYHHPSPFDLLVALRQMCGETLILRTSTIPEIRGLPNAAVYFPMLKPHERRLWDLRSLGVPRQMGITDGFEPDQGYGNWFWGMTPSCLTSLLQTAGFRVEDRATEAFAQTFICTPVTVPFTHRLPDEVEARDMAEAISAAGVARPA
jgi:SAM-dependent methyltransferase